jgi:soluble P-type ATPase
VKVVEVAFAATVTEAGTVSADGTLFERVTTLLAEVDFESVTVQVVLALGARLAAVHCRDETVGRIARERLAVADEPFSVPVTVAL